MQDVQSSSDQGTAPTPMAIPSERDDLLERMIDAFWCLENNHLTVSSKHRMVSVLQLLAKEIRTWAPDEGQARICWLAINEVADRLVREADKGKLQ